VGSGFGLVGSVSGCVGVVTTGAASGFVGAVTEGSSFGFVGDGTVGFVSGFVDFGFVGSVSFFVGAGFADFDFVGSVTDFCSFCSMGGEVGSVLGVSIVAAVSVSSGFSVGVDSVVSVATTALVGCVLDCVVFPGSVVDICFRHPDRISRQVINRVTIFLVFITGTSFQRNHLNCIENS
jgi:hypothetical protein